MDVVVVNMQRADVKRTAWDSGKWRLMICCADPLREQPKEVS